MSVLIAYLTISKDTVSLQHITYMYMYIFIYVSFDCVLKQLAYSLQHITYMYIFIYVFFFFLHVHVLLSLSLPFLSLPSPDIHPLFYNVIPSTKFDSISSTSSSDDGNEEGNKPGVDSDACQILLKCGEGAGTYDKFCHSLLSIMSCGTDYKLHSEDVYSRLTVSTCTCNRIIHVYVIVYINIMYQTNASIKAEWTQEWICIR